MRGFPAGAGRAERSRLNRRAWLLGAAAGALGMAGRAALASEDPTAALAEVRARVEGAGLGPVRSSETAHYVGIGDAPDAYRNKALEICRELAAAYEAHFREKGFAVSLPERRLVVVALKDAKSYAKYLGEDPGPSEGGHYDPETNRLVIFDFRPGAELPAPGVGRVNTFTLVHEELHQLTYNTGLLDPRGDVPVALSEGLATYGEAWQWQPRRRQPLGQINVRRLKVLARMPEEGWIPIGTLVTDDTLFSDEARQQVAYAESWALVHSLMKTPAALPRFRAYLGAIRPRRDPSRRLDDVRTHLGPPDELDRAVRKHAAREAQAHHLLGS